MFRGDCGRERNRKRDRHRERLINVDDVGALYFATSKGFSQSLTTFKNQLQWLEMKEAGREKERERERQTERKIKK